MEERMRKLQAQILQFRNDRNWKQFHKPKDMILSLGIEVAELAELFQWKNEKEISDMLEQEKGKLGDELADILYWVLLISADLDVDLAAAFQDKMKKNELKYPVELSRDSHKKYSEL